MEEQLTKLGLNRNEIKVYLTLLKLGTASAGQLIKETEFHRNIVYDNLEKLVDKGLVTFILEGKKKLFKSADPEMITVMLDTEQEKLNDKKQIAETVKTEIRKIQSSQKSVQEATIYRGIKGLKVLFKDTLEEGKDYYVIGAPKASLEILGSSFWENYNLKREKKKIMIKMIFNAELREWSKKIVSKITKIKFLPKQFDGISETMVYGDKVAIFVWTEKPIATLIKDFNLANSYKQYFNLLWDMAKE